MSINFNWEKIERDTLIAKVHGGWVIKYEQKMVSNDNHRMQNYERNRGRNPDQLILAPIAMVFIPDPDHQWFKQAELLDHLTKRKMPDDFQT
jgi:hypothetical protein